MMSELYLEVHSDPDDDSNYLVPLETLVILFGYKFCAHSNINIVLVKNEKQRPDFKVNLNGLTIITTYGNVIPCPADLCELPVFISEDRTTCIAGLCAVIRQIFKTADLLHPLLGFKQSCLYACAEVSLWTRFCEIDAVNAARTVYEAQEPNIPVDVARFEVHLAQPVRVHNVMKVCQEMSLQSERQIRSAADIEHIFAEGASISIADVIIFPCLHIVLSRLDLEKTQALLPLTTQWYQRMKAREDTKNALQIIGNITSHAPRNCPVTYTVPDVPFTSLYKSDPKRYKPRHRIYTRQEDIDESIKFVSEFPLDMIDVKPFGAEIPFDWDSVPWYARPGTSDLPERRILRKSQQLEAMTRAILKIARNGDRIVDFCAGSGHLGLILAHSLPRCCVILLENKQESLNRARERANSLQLKNIFFCQSNVDYFKGCFEVGVSLHACGVATDLVLETCIRRGASFVSCPCCYGSIQPNHIVTYPRSQKFKNCLVNERQYLVLGHAADQTHDDCLKSAQGAFCMNLIDGDRCLRAREAGYWVTLGKLYPITCTQKNNLLIGLPKGRSLL